MTSLRLERWYPFVAAGISAALWLWKKPAFPVNETEFLAAALSLGAILTGFIATAKAILAALPSDSVMGRLRQSGYVNDLIRYLGEALYSCFTFSLACLLGFFLLHGPKTIIPLWYAVSWVFLGTYSVLSFYRVSRLLLRIIKFNPDSTSK